MNLKFGSLAPTLIETHTGITFRTKKIVVFFQRTLKPLLQFSVRKPGHLAYTNLATSKGCLLLGTKQLLEHIFFRALEGYKPSLQSVGALRVRTFIQVDISSSRSVVKVSLRYIFNPADMCANSLIVE